VSEYEDLVDVKIDDEFARYQKNLCSEEKEGGEGESQEIETARWVEFE